MTSMDKANFHSNTNAQWQLLYLSSSSLTLKIRCDNVVTSFFLSPVHGRGWVVTGPPVGECLHLHTLKSLSLCECLPNFLNIMHMGNLAHY